MARQFLELQERLLKAGIAPRHVTRYLAELSDHLDDLRTEEINAGRNQTDAESGALLRLGDTDALFQAMAAQRELKSWLSRLPWASYTVGPLLFLAGTYFIALLILWSGWRIFIPNAATPFGARTHGFGNTYFQLGRAIYYAAPVLTGWMIAVFAARQRSRLLWPAVGATLIALAGSTVRVQASRTERPHALGHIQLNFSFRAPGQSVSDIILSTLILLSFAALPYLLWRLQKELPWRTARNNH